MKFNLLFVWTCRHRLQSRRISHTSNQRAATCLSGLHGIMPQKLEPVTFQCRMAFVCDAVSMCAFTRKIASSRPKFKVEITNHSDLKSSKTASKSSLRGLYAPDRFGVRPKHVVIRYMEDENKCFVWEGGYTYVQKATILVQGRTLHLYWPHSLLRNQPSATRELKYPDWRCDNELLGYGYHTHF
jgi:hypothetical protein